MSKPDPNSLAERTRRYLLDHGECSLHELVGALGKHIPATKAIQHGRYRVAKKRNEQSCKADSPRLKQYTLDDLAQVGRREKITTTVMELMRRGLVRRVCRGVYAPPEPKLFQPGQSA